MIPICVVTCLRDALLVHAQIRAAKHFWGDRVFFSIYADEHEAFRVREIVNPAAVGNAQVFIIEHYFDVSGFRCGYHRQQWVKLNFHKIHGKHIQLDSDMIPCMPFDVGDFFKNPVWDYDKPFPRDTFHFGRGMRGMGLSYDRSYMTSNGWVIFPELVTKLHTDRPHLRELYTVADVRADIDVRIRDLAVQLDRGHVGFLLEELRDKEPLILSEYNILGATAQQYPELRALYLWNDVQHVARNLLHRSLWNANARVSMRPEFTHRREVLQTASRLSNGESPWKPPAHVPNPSRFYRSAS